MESLRSLVSPKTLINQSKQYSTRIFFPEFRKLQLSFGKPIVEREETNLSSMGFIYKLSSSLLIYF